MILCDTGIIVANIVQSDRYHKASLKIVEDFKPPLITTWPCITEAMYLVGQKGYEKLYLQIQRKAYKLYHPVEQDIERAGELMQTYADAPMDFADASLVVAAEQLNTARILTLDRHFHIYRINNKILFDVIIPEIP